MEQSATTSHKRDWSLLAIGAVFAGAGIYFGLVGIGAVPSPSKLYGPNWIALAVGLVFFATGLSVSVRGFLGVSDNQASLPPDAPAAAVAVQWLAALAVVVGLASIGSWIAIGAGERSFTMMLPVQGSLGETVGRVAFGIGALITWLMAAAMAVRGIKQVFGKK